jgi:glycerol-3-phosphate acyltransferase PlsX
MLKTEIESGLISRLGGLLIKKAAYALKKKIDYEEYGGAPLLGVDGTVIICHGKSNAKAIFNAIRVSGELVTAGAKEQIRSSLEEIKSKMEFARITQ